MFKRISLNLVLAIFIAFLFHNCRPKSETQTILSLHKKITFHVIPKVMPDSAIVYVSGNDSLLGNWHPAKVPLTKYGDGSWRKTFIFRKGTKLQYKITRGDRFSEALNEKSGAIAKYRLMVKNDTSITIHINKWKDMPFAPLKNSGAKIKVTFKVIPKVMPDADEKIYITGDHPLLGQGVPYIPYTFFRNWAAQGVQLEKQTDGSWTKTIIFPAGLHLEYKITRGSWAKEALDEHDQLPENYALYVRNDTTHTMVVNNWEDLLVLKENEKINLRIAEQYFCEAELFLKAGQIDSALFYYEKAMLPYAKARNWIHYINCHLRIGWLWERKLEWEKTLIYFNKALEIALNKSNEEIMNLDDFYCTVAYCFIYLGMLNHNLGDFDNALKYHFKALSTLIQHKGENDLTIARCYNYIGVTNTDKGNSDQAIDYFKKAITCQIKNLGNDHPDLVLSYMCLGDVLFEKAGFDEAIKYLKKSITIYPHLSNKSNLQTAMTYFYLGIAYHKKGEFDKSLSYYYQSINEYKKIFGSKKNIVIGGPYLNLADIYFRKKNYDKALQYIQKSIISYVHNFDDHNIYTNPPLKSIAVYTGLLEPMIFKAEIFEKRFDSEYKNSDNLNKTKNLKDLKMALACCEHASDIIEKLRHSYKAEGSKYFIVEDFKDNYARAVRIALQLNLLTQEDKYETQAFEYAEKCKAAVLLQSLNDIQAKMFSGIPDSLLQQEKQLKIELASCNLELDKEKQKKDSDRQKIEKLENKSFRLHEKYNSLIEYFEKQYPDYYHLKHQSQLSTIQELQQTLNDKSVLIEYFVGDSLIHIFTIDQSEFDVTTIPKDDELTELIKTYFSSIKRVLDKDRYLNSSVKLYQKLVKPIEDKIAAKQKLIIIPDEILHYVPFEALITEKNTNIENSVDFTRLDYLIKHFEIAYQPSSTIYLNDIHKEYMQYAANGFLGFAPIFNKSNDNGFILASNESTFAALSSEMNLQFITRDGKRFEELKHSENEVQTITKLFDQTGEQGIGFFHGKASEKNFKQNAGKFKYVHISTHGFVNEDKPQLSGLAFSQPDDSSLIDDGLLYSGETFNLDLNADLVVLSSCESGMGKLVRGEGLMTLARGFLYSGANNVVVSLWKVFDEHTSQLMIEFYTQIVAGKSYSAALREAKLRLIENENTAFPTSWSSFVLIGR